MFKTIVIFVCLVSFPTVVAAASREDTLSGTRFMMNVYNQDGKILAIVAGVNAVLGCLKAGIGSFYHNESFFMGCTYGLTGGLIMTSGQVVASFTRELPGTGAMGKIVNDIGLSIEDNVMLGRQPLSVVSTDLGPLNLYISKDGIDWELTMIPVGGLVYNAYRKNDFRWKESLYNLTPIFVANKFAIPGDTGQTIGNVVSSNGDYTSLSHEMNHVLLWSNGRSMKHATNRYKWMEIVQQRWNLSQDLAAGLLASPSYFKDWYWYNPIEMSAYGLERP